MVIAAYFFAAAIIPIIVLQMGLTLGAPWGHMAMGGKVAGAFPPGMRVTALLQGMLLVLLAYVVLRHSGAFAGGPVMGGAWLIWIVVAISAVTTVLNAITTSKPERRLGLPVALVMLATSLVVALSPAAA